MEGFAPSTPMSASVTLGAAAGVASPSRARIKRKKKKRKSKVQEAWNFSKTGPFEKFSTLPPLCDTKGFARSALMKRKLHALCRLFRCVPGDSGDDKVEADAKRHTLMEVIEFAFAESHFFSGPNTAALVRMVAANLFRTDRTAYQSNRNASLSHGSSHHPHTNSGAHGTDDLNDGAGFSRAGGLFQNKLGESSASWGGGGGMEAHHGTNGAADILCKWWAHQQIVYEILLRFIVSPHVVGKVAKRHLPRRFVRELVGLIRSGDPRERSYVKTIIHRLYEKAVVLRSFVRRCIEHEFLTFMDLERTAAANPAYPGLNDLLEIYCSIIDGYCVPLRAENMVLLDRILLPLHKVRSYPAISSHVAACLKGYLEKDPSVAVKWAKALAKWWPRRDSTKTPCFFQELNALMELIPPGQFNLVAQDVFATLSACMLDPHFQVAEQALLCWRSEYFVSLVAQHRSAVLPLVYPALHENAKSHWHPLVKSLSSNVLRLFSEIDPYLLRKCGEEWKRERKNRKTVEHERKKRWEDISIKLQKN